MGGKATLNTILRLHVGVQLCKRSQKSSRVNLQKSDVQPKPIQYSKHCIGRDVVKGGKKEFQSTWCSHMHEVTVSLRCSFDLAYNQKAFDVHIPCALPRSASIPELMAWLAPPTLVQ